MKQLTARVKKTKKTLTQHKKHPTTPNLLPFPFLTPPHLLHCLYSCVHAPEMAL